MKQLLLFFFFLLWFFPVFSQKHTLTYKAETGGALPAGKLPFWLHTNTYGKITGNTYLWGTAGLSTPFSKSNTRAFDFSFGAEGTGSLEKGEDNRLFVNQLYGRLRWQNLVLTLGLIAPDTEYEGLSATNGNMLYSTNSRNLPGISLSTWDFIKLPWIGKWISFKGQYEEYMMTDKRYAGKRTRLHHKMLDIKFTITPCFSFEAGLDHYAQWAGTTTKYGKLPASFKDYHRVVLVKEGGEDAPENEINKLGNHIGMHFAKFKYHNENWAAEFYYNHIFEDGSGEKFRNRPDGLYGFYFTRTEKQKWLKSILYEFYYTKCQSGPYHNDPVSGEIVGGNDNYFNNGIYQSGWTFFGHVIGSPFFIPRPENEEGITIGILNNRFYAHHLGICGELPQAIQYKLRMSYSLNYGTHSRAFRDENNRPTSKPQFSLGLELTAPDWHLPFRTALNIGFDRGDIYKNNFGVMIKLFKTGIF